MQLFFLDIVVCDWFLFFSLLIYCLYLPFVLVTFQIFTWIIFYDGSDCRLTPASEI